MKSSKSLYSRLASHVKDIPGSGIRSFFDIVNEMSDAISLGVGEPGCQTPWHIRDAAIYALEKGATGYTSNSGLLSLRESISRYVARFFQAEYSPEHEILITTGLSEAYDLAIRALVDPGDEVIFHQPSYVSYGPVVQMAHGVPVALETFAEDDFQLNLGELEKKISTRTKLLVLNFPNNPTGAILDASMVREIADLAIKHDLLVLSDEIYGELTYDSGHCSILSIPEMRERTILLHGMSKAWAMTGFRIGYACAPREIIEAMNRLHQYTMLCAPTLSQIASIEAFKGADRDIPELRDIFRKNRNYMFSGLNEIGLPCAPLHGAFYAFPSISELGMTSSEFALSLLEEEKVAVVPGTAFGNCGEGHIRCSYASSFEEIKIAMERLGNFVERARKN